MKKIIALLASTLLLTACPYDDYSYQQPSEYKPILMAREELENSIKLLPPQSIEKYGKIYTKDNFLYINDFQKGVHIVDNTDPSSPKALAFISIPGNVDISIKNNIIYADNATDLVALKYDGSTLTEVDRNRAVFPEPGPPDGLWVDEAYTQENRPENTVIIKWIKK
jgi:hypothetical protein